MQRSATLPSLAAEGTSRRLYQLDGDELANELWSVAEGLRKDNTGFRRRCLEMLCRYEGRKLEGLYAGAYTVNGAEEQDERLYRVGRMLAGAIQAEIAGGSRPKPAFITSGADWKVRRRAKKLDRFAEATLCPEQDTYLDSWELVADVFLDTLIWPFGVIKAVPFERMNFERCFPWEILTDPVEAHRGKPQNMFHSFVMDRDKALGIFGDDEAVAEAIENAPAVSEDESDISIDRIGSSKRLAQSIRVVQWWRLPISKDKPGKTAYAINGKLLDKAKDWTRNDFPLVILRWSRERLGFGGVSLLEEVATIEDMLNDTGRFMRDKIRICSGRRVYYTEHSIDETHLASNEAETFIPVAPGAMPNEVTPEPLSQSEVQWFGLNWWKLFELPGVSQMMATSQLEPGINSGIGMRTRAALASKRFAIPARMYEGAFIALAKQAVRGTRDLAEEDADFSVKWPGRRFLNEIAWNDVNLEEDQYEVSIQPASMLQREQAGILSTAQELFASGQMSPIAFKSVISQTADLESILNRDTAESEYIDKMIDRYLDADEEEWEAGDYEEPDGHISDKIAALVQLTQAYFEARCDDAPDFNLDLLRRYIKTLDKQVQDAQAFAAQMQAQASAPVPGAAGTPPVQGAPLPAPGAGAPMPPGATLQ